MLSLSTVTSAYGSAQVLNGASLSVLAGEVVALLCRNGVGYVPQGRGIFDKQTVLENLEMGLRCNSNPDAKIPAIAYERFPILHERRSQIAGTLSGGQKQQLAISRALCRGPKILLLDEPSDGIQPNIETTGCHCAWCFNQRSRCVQCENCRGYASA